MLKGNRGVIVLAKWPRPRPGAKSALQQAWIDRFSYVARALKSPDPTVLMAAQYWTKDSGWYYRDILEYASYGKLIRFQGEEKVRTPTVKVTRATGQNLGNNTEDLILATAAAWDNNAFWSATVNPGRLTVKTAGLYLLHAYVYFPVASAARRDLILKLNGTSDIERSFWRPTVNQDALVAITTIQYFHANEWVGAYALSSSAGANVILLHFSAVAITPEALIP